MLKFPIREDFRALGQTRIPVALRVDLADELKLSNTQIENIVSIMQKILRWPQWRIWKTKERRETSILCYPLDVICINGAMDPSEARSLLVAQDMDVKCLECLKHGRAAASNQATCTNRPFVGEHHIFQTVISLATPALLA